MKSAVTTTLKFAVAMSTLFGSSPCLAGSCCNTPTIWTIKNESPTAVTLSCKLESSLAWTSSKTVGFATAEIAPSASYAHNWGGDWYGDGMGMIPGKWSCENKNASTTSKKSIQFSTDWGENIVVTWNQGEPKIARSETAKPVDDAKQ